MIEPALRARGLEKRFGRVEALRGVDLELGRGRSIAVLGPNGAGKSSLLRILAGLARPTAGTLHIDGHTQGSVAARSRVGFVGHATLLYADLTARENLVFAGRMTGVRNAANRAEQLLEEEGLAAVADRRAGTFSRGMSQRLAIARSLMHDPKLVLLDEPFTGLDRRSTQRLTERLARMPSEGRSLVLVTHDVRHVRPIADRAVVLAQGRVVHEATGDDLAPEALEAAAGGPPDARS